MKIKLLALIFLGIFCAEAQTTIDLDWDTTVGTTVDTIINVGDTVRWTWTDALFHTVDSDFGSAEDFSSGPSEIFGTFQYTFTEVGDNPYFCGEHGALIMSGMIRVQTLGIEDFSLKSFTISPNPSSLNLNIVLPNNITNAKVEVYDVLGKLVYNNEITKTPIIITDWSRGVYFVRVSTSNAIHTKRFVKQ